MTLPQIIISAILFIALVVAIVAFIKTPKDQRYVRKYIKKQGVKYAPEYSTQERAILVLKYLAWAALIFIVLEYWLFPSFIDYVKQAHCYDYGSFTGAHVVFYGLFIGLPIFIALLIFAIQGPSHLKAYRSGQYPPPNEKVFQPTEYVYGVRAKLRTYILFAILLFLVGLGIRGFFWANEIIEASADKEKPACTNSESD